MTLVFGWHRISASEVESRKDVFGSNEVRPYSHSVPQSNSHSHPNEHIYYVPAAPLTSSLSPAPACCAMQLAETPPESWLSIFMGSFNDATLIVLIVSAVVSLVIGMYEVSCTQPLTHHSPIPYPLHVPSL